MMIEEATCTKGRAWINQYPWSWLAKAAVAKSNQMAEKLNWPVVVTDFFEISVD